MFSRSPPIAISLPVPGRGRRKKHPSSGAREPKNPGKALAFSSAAKVDVESGDARLLLEDAFSGDAIPVHLLTKEAFETYLKHVVPDGIIAVHMSNRHVNLEPVLHGIVDEFPEIEDRATFTIEKQPFKTACGCFSQRGTKCSRLKA